MPKDAGPVLEEKKKGDTTLFQADGGMTNKQDKARPSLVAPPGRKGSHRRR